MALEMVEILDIQDLNPTVKTFTLNKKIDAQPGQYCMLWIPGVGEKPFGFARLEGNIEIMVRKIGKFTEEMFNLKVKDTIGFRGPYGEGTFKLEGGKICFVSGGVGIAPMLPLIEEALKKNLDVTVIHGAASEEELVPLKNLENKVKVILTTDDGSCGDKGTACDALEKIIDQGINQIYTCGPEQMMKKVADKALEKRIPCQISMERFIKCGIGICGQCSIDPEGFTVCRDGPVFNAETLQESEFGKYRRDKSGSRIDL